MPDVLPASLRRASEGWRIANASASGGRSPIGLEQVVAGPGGYWKAKLSLHLVDPYDYTEAGGFLASLDGQAGTFYAGPSDWRGQPWPVDPLTGGLITPDKRARDLAVDPTYDSNPDTTGALSFALASPVPMNGTQLTITRNRGGFVRRGQYIQIGERLHVVTALLGADPPAGNGQAINPYTVVVAIRPWTRAAYPAGTTVEMGAPLCLMRLADPDQGQFDRTPSPLSSLSLDIVEAI